MQKSNFRAQGTIEYLVIVAVVIVISLIVVGLVITQVDSSADISSGSSEIGSKVGVSGISISSSVAGADENGLLVIKNLNPENLFLKKIVVDGVDHNFYEQIVANDQKSFKLQDLLVCDNEKKNYSVKIEYISDSGLTKIADFQTITVDCTEHATPVGAAVEEYKDPVCEGDQFLYRFPGSEYKKKCVPCSTNSSTGFFDTGDGTESNPFMICDWNQLNNVRESPTAYFKLMTDLGTTDANYADFGDDWEPIGEPDYCDDGNCSTSTTCETEFGCDSTWRFAGETFCAPSFTDIGDIYLNYSPFCNGSESICTNTCGGYWYEQGECSGNMNTYCATHDTNEGDCSSQNGCSWTAPSCSGSMSSYCNNNFWDSPGCNSATGCNWTSWGGWCDGAEECWDYDQSTCQSHPATCYWYDMGTCESNTTECNVKELSVCNDYDGCTLNEGTCSSAGTECNYNYDESSCNNYPACDWDIVYTQCELYLSTAATEDLCNSNSQICSDCYYYDSGWSNSEYGTWYSLSEDVCLDERCSDQNTCEKDYGCNSNWNTTTFSGNFNGKGFDENNHNIQDLIVNKPTGDYAGLFGYVTGDVSNTALVNVDINGYNYAGGVVAHLNGGSISDCDVNGIINSLGTSGSVGGIVGKGENNAVITNSSAKTTITGKSNTGGIVGSLIHSSLNNSYSQGSINATGNTGGGLFGNSGDYSTITNCYRTGTFTGSAQFTGNLFGTIDRGNITNVFSSGTRTYPYGTYYGYFGGYAQYTAFINAYAVSTGWNDMYGLYFQGDNYTNSGAKSDADLKNYNTFLNDGWDIGLIDDYNDEKWVIDDGVDYPMLDWQLTR